MFGASSELASVMEFGFIRARTRMFDTIKSTQRETTDADKRGTSMSASVSQ